MSESSFYCLDCKFILNETSHLIDKSGVWAHLICGKCGSEFTLAIIFKGEPELKRLLKELD